MSTGFVDVQAIKIAIEHGVELDHVAETVRRFQIEGLHQARVVAERGGARVSVGAKRKIEHREDALIERPKCNRLLGVFKGPRGIARLQQCSSEVAVCCRVVGYQLE